MKKNKSPGPDQITNEHVKYGAYILPKKITVLFNSVLKKSLAQEVRQNRDISERRSKVEGGELYFQHGRWVDVRPVRSHLTPKINITFYIRNLMQNIYFFIQQSFQKKLYFQRKL